MSTFGQTFGQKRRSLLRSLRQAQTAANAQPATYAGAFGLLEKAVARHLGEECVHCGLANTSSADKLCDACREKLPAKITEDHGATVG